MPVAGVKEMINKIKTVKIEESTLKKMGVFIITVLAIFITIILIYSTYLFIVVREAREDMEVYKIEKNSFVKNHEFNRITLSDDYYYLGDECSEVCYFKVDYNKQTYYISIAYAEGSYSMEIYNIYFPVKELNLGKDISTLVLKKYKNYLVFDVDYVIENELFDAAFVFNGKEIDGFYSMGIDEIEYTDKGITYDSFACLGDKEHGAIKSKLLREPFTYIQTIAAFEKINTNKC